MKARVRQWEKKTTSTPQGKVDEDWLYQDYPDFGLEVLKD